MNPTPQLAENVFLKKIKVLVTAILTLFLVSPVSAQDIDNDTIKKYIETFKKDDRGPYKDLRWFCPDGSLVLPKERCPQRGGVQRARYKDEVVALQKNRHIFLGQILATTEFSDFWDPNKHHSRLKQYQLERYLRSVDNGWILRKAQYYRGAIQAEDEETWGLRFFNWLLSNDKAISEQFFLIRQSLKDIPHRGDDNLAQKMRSQSQIIAEAYEPFMNLRIKIHGQPQHSDIEQVRSFKQKHAENISPKTLNLIDELIATMQDFFKPYDLQSLKNDVASLPVNSDLRTRLNQFTDEFETTKLPGERTAAAASAILDIRQGILEIEEPSSRLTLLDISNSLEELIYKEASDWEPETLQALLHKIYHLGQAAAGSGFVELWEWQQVSSHMEPPASQNTNMESLIHYLQLARSQVEWGTGMVNATYQEVVNQFERFEPLAYGFTDDRIRSSVLLPLGKSVSQLGEFITTQSGLENQILDIPNQSHIRGLNPGFAYGELNVVSGSPDEVEVSANKIYVFERPPADLKPVAGIATVTEGNLVSHVQLLARNLGIPNAVISNTNLNDLKAHSGRMVFYAVSDKGTVIIKPESEMTKEEKALFAVQQRSEDRIRVPVEKIRLDQTSILDLRDIKSDDSGIISGPKAANLGQLKRTFPDKVVEGLVIPFGIFRQHMDQRMPEKNRTYWEYLNSSFDKAEEMRENGRPESEIDDYLLKELETLREAIKRMPLLPSFLDELNTRFRNILGSDIGKLPVFIRSDTNMEDLKDFTGAGLNLTVFNVAERDKIIQGIKDVWASPYNERSFRWRQKFLLNPENVYPSILIIPTVNVDYSGVLITKGISSGNAEDLTIAFSKGAGGAVDGQVAESYLIRPSGEAQLIAPSREPYYNVLPITGGLNKQAATFQNPLLNEKNISAIRELAESVKRILPTTPGIESEGPYDIELGFKDDQLWLFQVRPFVENKRAVSSTYLESISPKIDLAKKIKLSTKL
jgi:hypothetical protein